MLIKSASRDIAPIFIEVSLPSFSDVIPVKPTDCKSIISASRDGFDRTSGITSVPPPIRTAFFSDANF